MNVDESVIERIRGWKVANELQMEALVAEKPSVVDGHSDGKRVRYVKAATRAHAFDTVLRLLEGDDGRVD